MSRESGDELFTERLRIRPFTARDAPEFLALVSLPEVLRHTGERAVKSVEEAENLLKIRQLRDYATYGYGRMACIEKSTGRLIGFSGLKYLEDLDETDIGYRFLPECWGHATESAEAVLKVQAARLGLKRIIGLVEPGNTASVRVLQKLGLSFEGHTAIEGHGQLDRYAIHP